MKGADPLLLVIDVQRVAAPGGPWELSRLDAIVPNVQRLLDRFGTRTVLTRHRLDRDGPGTWRSFARRWSVLDEDPSWWDLYPPLSIPNGASVVDKTTYSAFDVEPVQEVVTAGGCDELVLTGCETDCCIAATMFAAVDAGVSVTVVADACTAPDPTGHEAILASAARLPEQVQVLSTSELLAAR